MQAADIRLRKSAEFDREVAGGNARHRQIAAKVQKLQSEKSGTRTSQGRISVYFQIPLSDEMGIDILTGQRGVEAI